MPARTPVALLALALAAPAAAQGFHGDVRGVEPYGSGYGSGYGYAGEFVRGDYIGAPLTKVPSTLKIVPTPWSYGTYGVPTVSGIPPAPVAQPTITLINGRGPKDGRRAQGWAEPDRGAAARIIEVQVPRR